MRTCLTHTHGRASRRRYHVSLTQLADFHDGADHGTDAVPREESDEGRGLWLKLGACQFYCPATTYMAPTSIAISHDEAEGAREIEGEDGCQKSLGSDRLDSGHILLGGGSIAAPNAIEEKRCILLARLSSG